MSHCVIWDRKNLEQQGHAVRRRISEKEQKKLADDARLLRAWKKFHREELEAVVAGPHGAVLRELLRMFENLEHVRPSQLIGLVGAIDWAVIDYSTRLTVLHELNNSITAFRVKHGVEPIDDNLPDAPDTPFRTIKAILFPSTRAPAGAQPGPNNSHPQHKE
jgi:hypothetical protein